MNLKNKIEESVLIKRKLISEEKFIKKAINKIYSCLKNKNKVLICGNGGSAADAQHLSAEFLVRLRPNVNREPFPILSLALDTSTITACGNDYSFDELFSRNFQALYKKGDILMCISTSGNSKNVTKALEQAKKQGLITIGFTGKKGGEMNNHCDLIINIPSNDTPRIQECHLMLGHAICELVEKELFS